MASLSPELLAQLNAYFSRPQGVASDLSGPDASYYRGAEYYDPATSTAYVPRYGFARFPDGSMTGQLGSDQIAGYQAYRWDPGMYSDNSQLNGTPYQLYDATGADRGTGTWSGLGDPILGNSLFEQMLFGGGIAGAGALTALGMGGAAAGAAVPAGTGVTVGGPMSVGTATGTELGTLGAGAGTVGAGTAAMGAGGGAAGATGTLGSLANSIPGGMGTLASVGGALLGSQGVQSDQSATRQLPPYLQGPVANDLIPRTQGLLASQMPQAQSVGDQMVSAGQGLLNMSMTPDFANNPYMTAAADDLQRRTADLLGQNNRQIQGTFVGTGGLGGSRQGVAQGLAASRAADSLQGNLANMFSNQYNIDASRALQAKTIGAGMMGQGLQTQFSPLNSATGVYSPFSGFGTMTQNSSQGGGAMGALGGALGTAQLANNLGWFGGGGSSPTANSNPWSWTGVNTPGVF